MPIITLRRKRIIIDVDTQSRFFLNTSIVCVRNHQQVLANIRMVMDWAQFENIRMISTVQILTSNNFYCNPRIASTEGQKKISCTLRRRHTCFDTDSCIDLPPEILNQYDQVILYKRCFDPFEEPRVDRMLSGLQADELILIGTPTEGAVKATALGLLARQKKVTVLIDATGSYNKTIGKIALRRILERGGKLTDTRTLLSFSSLQLIGLGNLG